MAIVVTSVGVVPVPVGLVRPGGPVIISVRPVRGPIRRSVLVLVPSKLLVWYIGPVLTPLGIVVGPVVLPVISVVLPVPFGAGGPTTAAAWPSFLLQIRRWKTWSAVSIGVGPRRMAITLSKAPTTVTTAIHYTIFFCDPRYSHQCLLSSAPLFLLCIAKKTFKSTRTALLR